MTDYDCVVYLVNPYDDMELDSADNLTPLQLVRRYERAIFNADIGEPRQMNGDMMHGFDVKTEVYCGADLVLEQYHKISLEVDGPPHQPVYWVDENGEYRDVS